MISKVWLLSFIFPFFCVSQTVTGKVIDKVTQQPAETVAVYFDNTTIGTTTNEKGEFSITYTDAVQSTLVISYLGYDKVFITDYRSRDHFNIELIEAAIMLDEVYLDYNDGLTRTQKLRLFRKEFLGSSKFAKSCKILNESDLVLRYDKRHKVLYASAKVPIKVENKGLQYAVIFDIIDFEVNYTYVNTTTNDFAVYSVTYVGTSFYKNLKRHDRKRIIANRETAYNGSVQHFMRALYNKSLKEEGYWIFYDKFRVDEWSYFKVEDLANSDFKKVTLSNKVSIIYNKETQSEIQLKIDEFFVDTYGNYSPIVGVYFSGEMGSQRVGDSLPSDYGITD